MRACMARSCASFDSRSWTACRRCRGSITSSNSWASWILSERLAATRSARRPGSCTPLKRSSCSGEIPFPVAISFSRWPFTLRTSASASRPRSPTASNGSSWIFATRALVQGSSATTSSSVALRRPWTSTFTRPSGSFRWRTIWQMVPIRYTPSGARGASSFPSRCATANSSRCPPFRACSTAFSETSRETKSGTTMAGNTTTSRTGSSGSTSGMSSSRSTVSSPPAMGPTLPLRQAVPEASRFVGRSDHPARRQALQEPPAVSVLQGERGLGQLEGVERVLSGGAQLLDPGLHQGLSRGGERQLVDHHQAERVSLDVDAFPEALAGEEHAGLVLERLQELGLGPLALQQGRPGQLGREQLVDPAHVAQRGEQGEGAAAGDGQELPQLVGHRVREALVLRVWHALRQVDGRVRLVIERRQQHGLVEGEQRTARVSKSDPAGEVVERSEGRQGRRGEHDRPHPVVEVVLEDPGDVDRRGVEEQMARALLGPLHQAIGGARLVVLDVAPPTHRLRAGEEEQFVVEL